MSFLLNAGLWPVSIVYCQYNGAQSQTAEQFVKATIKYHFHILFTNSNVHMFCELA